VVKIVLALTSSTIPCQQPALWTTSRILLSVATYCTFSTFPKLQNWNAWV